MTGESFLGGVTHDYYTGATGGNNTLRAGAPALEEAMSCDTGIALYHIFAPKKINFRNACINNTASEFSRSLPEKPVWLPCKKTN